MMILLMMMMIIQTDIKERYDRGMLYHKIKSIIETKRWMKVMCAMMMVMMIAMLTMKMTTMAIAAA